MDPLAPPAASNPPRAVHWASPFATIAAQESGTGMRRRRSDSGITEHDPLCTESASQRRSGSGDLAASGPAERERQRRLNLDAAYLSPAGSQDGSGASGQSSPRRARRTGEVWSFVPAATRLGASESEVQRMSLEGGRRATPTRPRRTLEDVLTRLPSPTADQVPRAPNSLQIPSATTQDINDLLSIRRAAMRRSTDAPPALPSPARPASTRTRSQPVAPRIMRHSMSLDVRSMMDRRLVDEPADRGAFGTGTGLNWVDLMPTEEDPARAVQRNLAVYAEESDDQHSWIPLLKMGPTIIGKMGVAIGADLLTLGISTSRSSYIASGACLIGGGILAVMVGMEFLTRDMKKINPRRVPYTLWFSLIGMILISASVTISETDFGTQSLAIRTVSAVVFGCGLTMLNTSLPLSFAYSEMVHGDTFRDYRNEAAFLLWGMGLGMATGLTVSRGAPRDKIKPVTYPFGVAHAFAVLGIACATFGTCLVATNLQRQTGRLLALRTRLRQLAAESRVDGLPPDPDADQRV